MRLWHQALISKLPRQQLLGQHRECCALRGKGWGKKHSVVDYVFTHSPEKLVAYHMMIMFEMKKRGYKPDPIWENCNYRGKVLGEEDFWCDPASVNVLLSIPMKISIPNITIPILKNVQIILLKKVLFWRFNYVEVSV